MTAKKVVRGTHADKLEASRAWYYEWRMLNESAARIGLYSSTDKVVYCALIESFCAHLRNFIEFFHRKKKRPFWEDFLPPGKTISLKCKLNKYQDKVNALLSHCTYKRLEYTGIKKEWDVRQIADEINENMYQLIDAADKSLICNDMKAYREQLGSGNRTHGSNLTCTTSDIVSSGKTVSGHRGPTTFRRW